ncbi:MULTISPECIES: diacylglycerol kinase family protein [unclassified Dehalobacter]|uniref:diacylglycerol kinase family protein n=1 Tax=unclassified Dehalobacter TaxID=2635733 RepID=UPI000E6BDC9A|nr:MULTISPECIES: diacylglycerol kinase family protein [unclassified Dehalobacter]RJE47127.1 diacylglycerol kinase [Dehalobacter sp. MCB1]TCX53711.1 diacylglycerol kinase [Dehalobacter sp. 14DCB1]TCX55014.1 diacylglycerol kinase [Dehalobacter sp. 12DCB1]
MPDIRKPAGFAGSCRGALQGIAYSLRTEKHLRFHFFAAVVVVLAGAYFHLSGVHWLFIIYAIGSVLVAELFNTALERAIDLAEPRYHPLAGLGKDVASGAVLVSTIQAVVIGIIIFGPYLF